MSRQLHAFPDDACIDHELGHLLLATLYADRVNGVRFYVRHPRLRAATQYDCGRTSATRRIAIAVAGAVAGRMTGTATSTAASVSLEQYFLGGSNGDHPSAWSGDVWLVQRWTAGLPAARERRLVLAGIRAAERELHLLGGPRLLAALRTAIRSWLEHGKRARWRQAIEWPWASSALVLRHDEFIRTARKLSRRFPGIARLSGDTLAVADAADDRKHRHTRGKFTERAYPPVTDCR